MLVCLKQKSCVRAYAQCEVSTRGVRVLVEYRLKNMLSGVKSIYSVLYSVFVYLHCNDKDGGWNPTTTRNKNKTLGDPLQKVAQGSKTGSQWKTSKCKS